MVRLGSNEANASDAERFSETVQDSGGPMEQTLADMTMMAADRRDAGYETVTVPTGDTAPKDPDSGDDDKWGLTYVVPGNKAQECKALYNRASFDETGVYQATVGGITYIVTECLDHDAELALFVAGAYEIRHAPALVRTAMDRGRMYTHLKKLDSTHLGTIEHDDPEAFFPNPESIYAYEQ
ncbi:MAG: hypothetical protein ABEI57_02315 [Halapricum sp.]